MHQAQVTVDLDQLDRNIQLLRSECGDTQIMFVVKSDAYGHGLVPVATRAAESGVKWFAVAYFHEALTLRAQLDRSSILVLGPIGPEDVSQAVAQRITPVITSFRHAERLNRAAAEQNLLLDVHLKIDTGMGRFGLCGDDIDTQIQQIIAMPHLRVLGICSHFAAVEPKRPDLAGSQIEPFMGYVKIAEEAAGRRLLRHISSSRAVQFHREWDLDIIRPGILLYGYGSSEAGMRVHTRPILRWSCRLMQVKRVGEDFPVGYYGAYRTLTPTQIGTIPVGYADGFLRSLSNRGYVLVGGRRCPVVGRISMNWVTIELGDDSEISEGDEVVLIGEQGDDEIWADEVGRWAGTIAYESLTAIHPSIERQFLFRETV